MRIGLVWCLFVVVVSDASEDLAVRHERLRRLYEVGKVLHSSLEIEPALDVILEQAMKLTRASSASVSLVNPTTGLLEIEAGRDLPADSRGLCLRVGQGITGWVARTGKSARSGDVRRDPRYFPLRSGVNSELAAPLDVGDKVRGVLNVDSEEKHAFTAEDQVVLEELALQAAKVMQNTWLHEQLRFKARMFESLASVNQVVQSAVNLNEALDAVTREARKLMSAKLCSLFLLHETGERLELRSASGAGHNYLGKPCLDLRESLAGTVVRSRRAVQVLDVRASGIYRHGAVAEVEGLVSLLCAPLIHRQHCIGVLNLYTGERHNFSDEEIRVLAVFASAAATAIERARLYEHLRELEEKLRQNEKLSALGLLAAEMAHEIRNPLTVIKMIYHALDLQFDEKDPRSEDARILGQTIDRLNRILERILAYARHSEPAWQQVRPNALLQDLRLLIRHKLNKHGIQLRCELDPQTPPIQADPGQLEQAFLNLALNAVEAMPQGGLLTISTWPLKERHSETKRRQIAVRFEDTGEGMAGTKLVRAFGSVLGSYKPAGAGLGLAIVRRIVEAHSGQIKIRSAVKQGASITLVLPIAQDSSPNLSDAGQALRPRDARFPTPS